MTTGHLDDDDEDERSDPRAARGAAAVPPPPHPPPPPSSLLPSIASRAATALESKRKEDADDPAYASLSPFPSGFEEHKERSSSSHSSSSSSSSLRPPSPPSPSSVDWSFPSPPPFRPFFLHQWMDVCDPQGSWLEAQVIDGAEGAILVHYKGYKARYDEWLNASDPSHPHSARIAPLHTHTRPAVPLPSRPVLPLSALQSSLPYPIDCLDTADDWLPARLLSFDGRTALALVAYDGWSAPYNEYIGIDSYRIAPRGRYSQPTLFVNRVQWADDAASASAAQQNQHAALITRRKSDYAPTVDNEQRFRRLLLTTLRYHIVDQAEDGNCLFRAVSHQLYESSEWHLVVRDKCMTYVAQERAYFRAFVVGDWDAYVARMRQAGEWGDHVEIQAMSEIYDMPIEIFAYSAQPLRTYRGEGEASGRGVMRLSYHFASHYCSVVPVGRRGGLLSRRPVGAVEDDSIERRRVRREAEERERAEAAASRRSLAARGLQVSRSEFTAQPSLSDFDRAVAESMREMGEEEERKVEEVKRESEREELERKEMELVLRQSEDDDRLSALSSIHQHDLSQAMRDSMRGHPTGELPQQPQRQQQPHQATASAPAHPHGASSDDDMRLAIQLSLSSSAGRATQQQQQQYPAAVQKLLDLGFPVDSCLSAYSVFEGSAGGEELLMQNMMEYLTSTMD